MIKLSNFFKVTGYWHYWGLNFILELSGKPSNHLSHTQSPFCALVIFHIGFCPFCPGSALGPWSSYLHLLHAGITVVCYYTQLVLYKTYLRAYWVSPTITGLLMQEWTSVRKRSWPHSIAFCQEMIGNKQYNFRLLHMLARK
jgi:hypothetical protein